MSINFFMKHLNHPQNEEIPSISYFIFVYYSISKQRGKYAEMT